MRERSAAEQFEAEGYVVVPDVVSNTNLEALDQEVAKFAQENAGTRRLLDAPWCLRLAQQIQGGPKFRGFLPADAQPVQCTLFVKSASHNWLVTLHQDLSIPVAGRVESSQCSGWSLKEGYFFVQPPVCVLEQLAAVRVHLDDCDERNGALRVVPGSHRLGRLSGSEIHTARQSCGERSVPVSRGSAMVMRPLLLHASSKATNDAPRRVLHFVYGPPQLPEGLHWPGSFRATSGT